jgi:hypothetical protein
MAEASFIARAELVQGLRGLWAKANSTNDFSHPMWTTEIGYSHMVDGEYYTGLASLPADDEKHAEGLALGWEDREILVRYSPLEITLSTLLLEDQSQPSRVQGRKAH